MATKIEGVEKLVAGVAKPIVGSYSGLGPIVLKNDNSREKEQIAWLASVPLFTSITMPSCISIAMPSFVTNY